MALPATGYWQQAFVATFSKAHTRENTYRKRNKIV